jgi:hypothetical protein
MMLVVFFDILVGTLYIKRLLSFKELLLRISDKGIKIQTGKKCKCKGKKCKGKGKKKAKKCKKVKEDVKEIANDIEANHEPVTQEEPVFGNESILSDETEESLMIKTPVQPVQSVQPVQFLPTPMTQTAPQAYPPTIQIDGKTYVAVKVSQLPPNVKTVKVTQMPKTQF